MENQGNKPRGGQGDRRGRGVARGANLAANLPRRPGDAPPPAQQLQGVWARRPAAQGAGAASSAHGTIPRQGQGAQGAGGSATAQGASMHPRSQAPQGGGNGRQLQAGPSNGGRRDQGDVANVSGQLANISLGRGCGSGSSTNRIRSSDEFVRTRPENLPTKQGKAGERVILKANYFQLPRLPTLCLYQYRVDFSHEEDSIRVRRSMVQDHREALGTFVFDGTQLFTCRRIAESDLQFAATRRSDGQIFNITCRLVGDVMRGNPQYVHFYNMLLKRFMGHLNLTKIRNDFYDSAMAIRINNLRLDLWPGYFATISQCENDLLMCAEIKFKEMRHDSCLTLLRDFARANPGNYRERFTQAVVGQTVMTRYNNVFYRIDEINWKLNPESEWTAGETYTQYMMNKHGINIQDRGQPLMYSRTNARRRNAGIPGVYLIPEVCILTGKSDDMRNDFRAMQTLAQHTRLSPKDRMRALREFATRLTSQPRVQEESRDWSMEIGRELIDVPARVLKSETVFYDGKKPAPESESLNWIKSLSRNGPGFVLTVDLLDWVVIAPSNMTYETKNFVQQTIQVARGMNFRIQNPEEMFMRDDRITSYVEALSNLLDRKRPQIILCMLQSYRADHYGAIKKICIGDRGVPSQVVTKRVAQKGLSVATKVAIQIGCKIGCIPWIVKSPVTDLMVVGFDTYHNPMQKERSHGAMVSTVNATYGKYYSTVAAHNLGEELSNTFATDIIKAVKAYQEHNNNEKPKRILIYRDGVGDGYVEYVRDHELAAIKRNLTAYYGGKEPSLAFIIVTKRIRTRFFTKDGENPRPGTVVDDVVTNPEWYDFYLVSQAVLGGTVTPTHYHVIYNTLGIPPDNLQTFTNKLCYTYYNYTGPIAVPAPCQCAHKLAYLTGESLKRPVNEALASTLYYL